MRRLLIVAALSAGAIAAGAQPAGADAGANARTGSDGVDHSARNGGAGSGTAPARRTVVCTYRLVDTPPGIEVFDENGLPYIDDGEGHWYERWCDGAFAGVVYLLPRPPRDLATEAQRYLRLPLPQPSLSPTGDQLVNLPTWLWVDAAEWVERTSTVEVPGVSVTVNARPEAAIWNLGDGTVVTCDGPGIPYGPGAVAPAATPCTHTYARSSATRPGLAYEATVTIRWRVSWTATGAAGGGDLGVIERTTPFAVRVGEVHAINTPAG